MPSYRRVALFVGVLAAALTGWSGHAQEKRRMTLVDMLSMPRIAGDAPRLTRDGRRLLFTMLTTDWPGNRRVPQVWVVNADGSGLRQLTTGDNGASGGNWSPDGTLVSFVSRGNIFVVSPDGGTAKQLSTHATPLSPADVTTWSPDGRYIYFLASDPPTRADQARAAQRDDVSSYDEYVQKHVWRIQLSDSKEAQLTAGDFSDVDYSLGGKGVLLTLRAPTPLPEDYHRAELWRMKLDGTEPGQLTHNELLEQDFSVSPDGSNVIFLARANDRQEPYYNANLFIVPASGGTPHLVLPDFQYEVLRAAWGADGSSVWIIGNMGVHTEVFQVDVRSKNAREVTSGDHYIVPSLWSVTEDRQALVIDEPTRIGDVWSLAPGARTPARITGVYDFLDRDFLLPRQEKIAWKGADGVTVEGLLTYPIGYTTGTRYPLVVQLHGGPEDSDKFGWGTVYLNYQAALAAHGYAILRPNYRGSSGYGNAFYREPIGGYFKQSPADVLAGVDRVIAMGVGDPEKVAISGWSAGGHLVNKLITVSSRFKAASVTAGAADWISLYGETDTRSDRDLWFGGSVWQKDAPILTYWQQSPIKDAWKARTPTLFFAGERDPRVPVPQAIEMFRALRAHDVPAELNIAPREGHTWVQPRHQLFKMNREIEWFDKYVRNIVYTPEAAPQKPPPAR
jgi:dipeptidyl aminopeptidase/acylaminoacyl peptidase